MLYSVIGSAQSEQSGRLVALHGIGLRPGGRRRLGCGGGRRQRGRIGGVVTAAIPIGLLMGSFLGAFFRFPVLTFRPADSRSRRARFASSPTPACLRCERRRKSESRSSRPDLASGAPARSSRGAGRWSCSVPRPGRWRRCRWRSGHSVWRRSDRLPGR